MTPRASFSLPYWRRWRPRVRGRRRRRPKSLGSINVSDVRETGGAGGVPHRREGALQLRVRPRRRSVPARRRRPIPAFALGYWGEAMSYNHPLWAQQDLAAARKVLERLAPTAAARAAKAPAGKERELIEAADVLFGAGDKLARDIAYADAMKRCTRNIRPTTRSRSCTRWRCSAPARPGVKQHAQRDAGGGDRRRTIFQRNPKHPGAAHYIIHSFDDPDHAHPRRCPRRAPTRRSRRPPRTRCTCRRTSSSSSACGTTSWRRTSSPTRRRWIWREAKNLPRGREDFHTLSWLQYAYLQQGKFDEAREVRRDGEGGGGQGSERRTCATATRR